jgi:erythronate-4-phosphate dehydrogenase
MRIAIDSNTPHAAEAFGGLGEVRLIETGAFRAGVLRDVDVLVVRSETRVDRALLEGTAVRFVGTVTIGTDHIDHAYLRSRGIPLASAPGSNANSVKEYVLAAMLVLAERFGLNLEGMTLGVVGVGNIGSKMVRAGELLGMRVLQNDPPRQRVTGSAEFRPLEELMDADIVTLHVPLTKTGDDPTFHLFDRKRIDRMKPGAFLMNTSRGGVVETEGILSALTRGHLHGAVLDVWEGEPAIPAELLRNAALGTAHIAGYSLDGKLNAVRMVRSAVSEAFGVDAPWDASGLLPAPEHPRVEPPAGCQTPEELLRSLVAQAYDVVRDDRLLRETLPLAPEARAVRFSGLRKTYRVRREFGAFSVRVPDRWLHLSEVLRGLGFTVDAGEAQPSPAQ